MSITTETARHEPQNLPDDDVVDPLPAVAEDAGISIATLRREIRAGRGPIVTWLSTRRCGVRRKHKRRWLDAGAAEPKAKAEERQVA